MKAVFRINNAKILLGILIFSLSGNSCKKLVEVQAPITSVNQVNVYANDGSAISVLTGIYTDMSESGGDFTGSSSLSMEAGLGADEFILWSGISTTDPNYGYFTNTLAANVSASLSPGTEFWNFYGNSNIFACNAAIEGLTASTSLTPSVKQQLVGEAKFLRAFFYFYLVNLYGAVPLVTSTDWQPNATLSRTLSTQVYQQIISDLKDAQGLLSPVYLDGNLQAYTGTPQRLRPTQGAATALLARVYLYSGDYPDAETQSTMVINNSSQYSLTGLNDVFLANSSEAIWQLQPTTNGHNTEDAWTFIIPRSGPGTSWPVYLSNNLLNSFEAGDQRRATWVDSVIVAPDTFYYPYKYQSATLGAPVTEYLMVLRLAEQYLVRAEAEINGAGGGTGDAVKDLNIIRNRAGLTNYAGATDKASLLTAILHERQVELFTEWGHRWLDMKRTGNIDAVMSVVTPEKGGNTWNSYQQLYPIPLADIQLDQNLIQNQGY